MEEIHKKWDLTQKAFKTASKGLPNLKPNRDIYLIIAAWRDLQKDVEQNSLENQNLQNSSKNIIILGKNKLQDLYGPTLASRPQFVLSRFGKAPTKGKKVTSSNEVMNKQQKRFYSSLKTPTWLSNYFHPVKWCLKEYKGHQIGHRAMTAMKFQQSIHYRLKLK